MRRMPVTTRRTHCECGMHAVHRLHMLGGSTHHAASCHTAQHKMALVLAHHDLCMHARRRIAHRLTHVLCRFAARAERCVCSVLDCAFEQRCTSSHNGLLLLLALPPFVATCAWCKC